MNDTPTAAPTAQELAKAGIIEAAAKIAEGYSFYEASDYPVCSSIAGEIRKLAETAIPGVLTCAALPDQADILETIENAGETWKANGYATALAEVRDMANIGRALMERLPEGYSYNDCPAEIVTDLQNEIADLTLEPSEATEETGEAGNHDCLAKRAPDEPYFVILARDPDGPTIVDLWAQRRRAAGGDPEHCDQVDAIASAMRAWRAGPTGFASSSAPEASAYPRTAAGNGAGRLQAVWDAQPDLPPIEFTPAEEAAIYAAFQAARTSDVARASRHSTLEARVSHVGADDGYATAFYEIAKMLGIGARAKSPFEVWRDEMKPKLVARLSRPDAVDENVQQVAKALNAAQVLRCADVEYHRGYGAAIADFVAAMPQGVDGEPPRQWPPALTTELQHILGMMCFQLGAPAHLFQKIGEFNAAEGITLGKRAEDEQAFMLHKLIGFWFEHGEDWGPHASADLTRAKAAAAALEPTR